MEIVGLAGLIAVVWKLVDFAKLLANRDVSGAVTQASVWGAAFATALLARESDPFSTVGILGTTFGELDLSSVVLIALGIGSTASGVYDFKKAFDGTDSAATPPLLPGPHHHVPPPSDH